MINTIIFDFDGVLVNSEPLHYLAEKKLVEENISDITGLDSANQATLGCSIRDTIAYYKIFFKLKPSIDELLTRHDEILNQLAMNSIELMEGIPSLLNLISKCGYKYAIASSGNETYVSVILKQLGMYHLFKEKIFCVDMVANGKPHPDIFILAAGKMNASNDSCLVIEDSLNGIIAASRAGMKSLFLNSNNSINISKYNSKRINSISDVTLDLLQSF